MMGERFWQLVAEPRLADIEGVAALAQDLSDAAGTGVLAVQDDENRWWRTC
jgi:hypothetical protein